MSDTTEIINYLFSEMENLSKSQKQTIVNMLHNICPEALIQKNNAVLCRIKMVPEDTIIAIQQMIKQWLD